VQKLKQVHENAKPKLKDVCLVCTKCDGKSCISGVPGMGGCGGRAYRPRVPQNSVYYRLVEEHFEQLER
jgi:hypothetical protein